MHQDTKADGWREHIALVLERFLDLQLALQDHFEGNVPALNKIEAAMTGQQFEHVAKTLGVENG